MLSQRWENAVSKENGDTPFVDIWVRKNRNYKKDIKITTIPNTSYTHFTELVKSDAYAPIYGGGINDGYNSNEDRF